MADALKLRDLLHLVAASANDPQKVVEKAFEWDHARRLEVAKWLLTLASSLVVALAAAMASKQFNADTKILGFNYIYWLFSLASFFAISGLLAFWRAKVLHKRLLASATLVGRLMEIQPFLRRLARDGLL